DKLRNNLETTCSFLLVKDIPNFVNGLQYLNVGKTAAAAAAAKLEVVLRNKHGLKIIVNRSHPNCTYSKFCQWFGMPLGLLLIFTLNDFTSWFTNNKSLSLYLRIMYFAH
ncbi:hypothetical protein L9F63_011008, partial [Diploptera punctata]